MAREGMLATQPGCEDEMRGKKKEKKIEKIYVREEFSLARPPHTHTLWSEESFAYILYRK